MQNLIMIQVPDADVSVGVCWEYDFLFLIHDNNGPQSFSYIFHPPLLFSAVDFYPNV